MFANVFCHSVELLSEFELYLQRLPEHLQQHYRNGIAQKEVLSVKNDSMFKLLFNADTRKERLSILLSHILGFSVTVIESLNTENTPKTKGSKKSVIDILAELSTGEWIIIEIQRCAEEFLPQRLSLYSSEVVVRQYTVGTGESKKSFSFAKLKNVYTIAFIEKSPQVFEGHKDYLHKFSQTSESDPSFKPGFLQQFIIVELDKFLQSENEAAAYQNELSLWLRFIADDNNDTKMELARVDPEIFTMYTELIKMSTSKELLLDLLDEELYEFDQIARMNDAIYFAEQKAIQKGLQEGMQQGIQEGMQQGIQEGIQQGMQQGIKEGELMSLLKRITRKKRQNKSDQQIIQELDLENEELDILYRLDDYQKQYGNSLNECGSEAHNG